MDTLPLIDRLRQAGETLQEVANLATSLPEHREQAAVMALHMQLVRSYLTELALNLVKGSEPYDAVLITAKGKTPIA